MPRTPAPTLRAARRAAGRVANRALTLVGAPAVAEFRDLEVEGLANVPAASSVLIASHHRSPLDAAVVQAALDRPATVIPAELWWPVIDQTESERVSSLIEEEHLLLTFPEVHPSPDGKVHRGHIGLGALVLTHDLTVIPAAVVDHGRGVRFGAPITFERHRGLPLSRTLARAVSDEVMQQIVLVAGLDYDDSTSSGARAQARRERREQITARRLAAAARRRAIQAADLTRREQRELERADLARRAGEAELVARRHASEAASRDRHHHTPPEQP